MLTIKNGHISLYCHFNKIVKRPGTTFQSPTFSQKLVRKMFVIQLSSTGKLYFDNTLDSKEI